MGEINYVKQIYKTSLNYVFLGLMILGVIFIDPVAFLIFAGMGELALVLLAQSSTVQRFLNLTKYKEDTENLREAERAIVNSLPPKQQKDFESVRTLCDQIEKQSVDIDNNGVGHSDVSDILQKLSKFRYEYARILRAKNTIESRGTDNIDDDLDQGMTELNREIKEETNSAIRTALQQNMEVLKRRKVRLSQVGDLNRLFDARLKLVKSTLKLAQDEIYTKTSISGMTDLVDSLIANLDINDMAPTNYEELLTEAGLAFKTETKTDTLKLQAARSNYGTKQRTR